MQIREIQVSYRSRDVPLERGESFHSSAQVYQAFRNMADETVEVFRVLHLDGKNRVVFFEDVARGCLTRCIVHPRDVFFTAVRVKSASVIFLHNHPSGSTDPSHEDRQITQRLVETGKIIGIQVLDHIIIGEHGYYSFADQGEL